MDGGGIETFSALSSTESGAVPFPRRFTAEVPAAITLVSPPDLWVGSAGWVGDEASAFVSRLVSLWFLITAAVGSVVPTL